MWDRLKNYRDRFLRPVTERLDRLERPSAQTERTETLPGDLIRQMTEEKWRAADCLEAALPENYDVSCIVCGFTFPRSEADSFVSQDAFQGGRLLRYRCPRCGAIVGPIKMLLLSEEALSEDYRRLYAVYDEGDSTEWEIRTFYSLRPKRGGVYLNYGSGRWSKAIPRLRAQGWNVYGFEPYSAGMKIGGGTIVSDRKTLSTLTFDGIFSNNLLEHLRYPVDDLAYMQSLLTADGKMAHSTPCYSYRYEFSRFHLVFYTGDAVRHLCERLGMEIVSHEYDEAKEYNNYVFQRKRTGLSDGG